MRCARTEKKMLTYVNWRELSRVGLHRRVANKYVFCTNYAKIWLANWMEISAEGSVSRIYRLINRAIIFNNVVLKNNKQPLKTILLDVEHQTAVYLIGDLWRVQIDVRRRKRSLKFHWTNFEFKAKLISFFASCFYIYPHLVPNLFSTPQLPARSSFIILPRCWSAHKHTYFSNKLIKEDFRFVFQRFLNCVCPVLSALSRQEFSL